jgi:hypothetical protein
VTALFGLRRLCRNRNEREHTVKRHIILALACAGLATQVFGQGTPLSDERVAAMKEIEADTAEIRGLPFKHAVSYREMDKGDLTKYLEKKFRESATAEELKNRSRSFIAMGLYPKGFDMEKEFLALLQEQVGAFYDHATKGLVTFKDQQLGASFQRVLLAHELVHALQDQHFNFSSYPEMTMKDNDDRQRAFQCLFEGDATFIMPKAMMKRINMATIFQDLQQAMKGQSTERLDKAPPIMRDTLTFPYTAGNEFVTKLYATKNSYEPVNAAFKNLPKSTEQILHPEKFYDPAKRDDPRDIKLTPLKSNKWKLIDNNVLGELGIRLLFATQLPPPPKPAKTDMMSKMTGSMEPSPVSAEGLAAAAGWGGDRYHAYLANDGGTEHVGIWWSTEWDTEEDAVEFSDMLRQVLHKRFPDLKVKQEDRKQGFVVLEGSEVTARLFRKGDKVSLIQAPTSQFNDFSSQVLKSGGK